MNEIMSQFLTSEVQTVLFALLGIVVVLYLLSIFWAARDARARGFGWAWGLLSVVPIVGLVAYCMIRPPLLKADREEQDLELVLKQRELMKFGDCAKCGYPVEADYVLCVRGERHAMTHSWCLAGAPHRAADQYIPIAG